MNFPGKNPLTKSFITIILSALFLPPLAQADLVQKPPTDEERKLRDEFIHEGYQNRTKDELCKDSKAACSGANVPVTSQFGDSMIEAVAKMYGLFFSFTGLNYQAKGKVPGEMGEKKSQHDYCAMIVMASEMVAMTHQMVAQGQITAQPLDPDKGQLESLHRAAKGHETREKSAWMQVGGWGASCACYIAMLASHAGISGQLSGTMQWLNHTLKPVAACGLTVFYSIRAVRAKEAKEKTLEVAEELEKLTGKGKCNPISQNACYCAQPETKYDAKYCIPKEYVGRTQNPDMITSCVNSDLKADPQCQCRSNNSCYDTTFSKLASEFPVGAGFTSNSLNPITSLTRGTFDQASAQANSRGQVGAARNFLKNDGPFKAEDFNLSGSQKEQVKALKSLGLPTGVASYIASQAVSGKGVGLKSELSKEDSNLSNLSISDPTLVKGASSGNSHVLQFERPQNNRYPSYNQDGGPNMDFLNKFGKAPAGQRQEDKTLNFAERAAREAEIYKNPSRSIFEIISGRYRTSTWERFGVFKEN